MGFETDFLEQLIAKQRQYDQWNGIIDEMNVMKRHNGQLKREKASLEKTLEEGGGGGGVSDKKLEEENRGLKDEITSLLRYKSTTGDRLLELQTEKGQLEKDLNEVKAVLDEKLKDLDAIRERFSGGEDTVRQLTKLVY